MFKLAKKFFNICLLREGPEDLPFDSSLTIRLVAISLVISFWLGSLVHETQIAGLSSIAGLLFAYLFVKLLLFKTPERFSQTFTAMLGTVTLINLISVPVIYPLTNTGLNENLVSIFGLMSFALLIWVVVVYGFIFSRAISTSLGNGISISVAYTLLSIVVLELFLAGRVSS
jgi:hypothetical protein